MTELRRAAFQRSGGYCEAQDALDMRCCRIITWESMELSHVRHGANKTDTLDGVLASCKECHRAAHNAGGKPVSRKPGRVMNLTEARKYWEGEVCYCNGTKKKQASFCGACMSKLSAQRRYNLENSDDADQYRADLAAAELEILAWKAEERTA